jgi:hypothetical protein
VTGDARARLRRKIAFAIGIACASSPYEAVNSEWYREHADAVLDALTDDDLAELLGLTWMPASIKKASDDAPRIYRRLVGPWQAAP